MRTFVIALLLAISYAQTGIQSEILPPPLYSIKADSLYEAGIQHGKLASSRIQAWLNSNEMQQVWEFAQNDGKKAYDGLRSDSLSAHPIYGKELQGIAAGAKVNLDQLWAGQLMIELENMMNLTSSHCSDIFAKKGFAHGHNEDWSQEVAKLYYYVKYTPSSTSADFESCAGLAYPGSIVGWAPTWNAHGLFMTVNTLVPKPIRTRGITTSFIQRDAICGIGKGRDMDSFLESIKDPHWADGASINIADTKSNRMANIEVYENQSDVYEVFANYSHFNAYKRLMQKKLDGPEPQSWERQKLADSWPAPQNASDVAKILSDKTSINGSTSIFRNTTIATLLLDGSNGELSIHCCQNPANTEAVYRWNLNDFFDDDYYT